MAASHSALIDIHLHLLPGLDDDEPSTMDESFEFALVLFKAGLKHVIATPHQLKYGRLPNAAILGQVAELNARLRRERAELTVWPGCEISLDPLAVGEILGGSFSPLGGSGGRYLIEIGEFCTLDYAAAAVEELVSEGMIPVIAHPERSLFWPDCPDSCEMLVDLGAEIQINACSLTGFHGGKYTAVSAKELLKRGLVTYVASDSHGLTDGRLDEFLLVRSPLEKLVGTERTAELLWDNPAGMLGIL